MGLSYCLFNTVTNERFELSKALWISVFDQSVAGEAYVECDLDVFNLYKKILIHVAPFYDKNTRLNYFYEVAERLVRWYRRDNTKIELWTDSSFYDNHDLGNQFKSEDYNLIYPITGTVYFDDE